MSSLLGGPEHPECLKFQREQKLAEDAAHQRQLMEEKAVRERQLIEENAARHHLMMEQINNGVFKPLNDQAEIMLDEGEICCVLIKGCWSTLFYPSAVGRVLLDQALRTDGLKKRDFGSLHVTDKRICFIGKSGAKTLPLKKLIQCEAKGDTLHVTVDGRASSTYFIIESNQAVELACAAVRKLATLAKLGKKPIIG